MPRSTMGTLITTLRRRINDTAGTAQVFTDDDLQLHLDNHRLDVYHELLTPISSWVGGGTVAYYDYRSRYRDYETTSAGTAILTIEDGIGTNVGTASWASMDYQTGILSLTTDHKGTALYLTGRSYDLYGAAADAFRDWAGRVALEFDFSSDQQAFSRSQKQKMLLEAAERMARNARPRTTKVTRGDVTGNYD